MLLSRKIKDPKDRNCNTTYVLYVLYSITNSKEAKDTHKRKRYTQKITTQLFYSQEADVPMCSNIIIIIPIVSFYRTEV